MAGRWRAPFPVAPVATEPPAPVDVVEAPRIEAAPADVPAVPERPIEVQRIDEALARLRHVTVDDEVAGELRAEAQARAARRIAAEAQARLAGEAAARWEAFTANPSEGSFAAVGAARRRAQTAGDLAEAAAHFAEAAVATLGARSAARRFLDTVVAQLRGIMQVQLVDAAAAPIAFRLEKAGQLSRTTSEDLEALAAWEEWSGHLQAALNAAAALSGQQVLDGLMRADTLIGETVPELRAAAERTARIVDRADLSRQAHGLPENVTNGRHVDDRAATFPATVTPRRSPEPPAAPGVFASPAGVFAADMPFRGPADPSWR